MTTGLLAKLALTTVAAVGLYAPTMGLPLPLNSCLRTVGVANAAPSPTCASDLRDCLRGSAKTGLYGVRYVTADDVARCMEAFNACISGGASRGGNASPSKSTAAGGGGTGLPERFRITYDATTISCRVDGTEVSCTEKREDLPSDYSETGEITGTVSGLTIAGTANWQATSTGSPCTATTERSAPIRFEFSREGSVNMRFGETRHDVSYSGDCPDGSPYSTTFPEAVVTATWAAE